MSVTNTSTVTRRIDDKTKHAEEQVPATVPTLAELKRALPARCFNPTLTESFYYVLKDLAIVTLLYAGMLAFTEGPFQLSWTLKWLLVFPTYWFLQGTMFWAIFVLGHDCGHGSFSSSPLINDVTGNLLHSFIMVPYYPWKLSHHHHHKNTGNIDKDEIFYPQREGKYFENGKEKPRMSPVIVPYFGLGVSWFLYMLWGYEAGHRNVKHLYPYDKLFSRHFVKTAVSLGLWSAWILCAVVPYAGNFGLARLAAHYLAPIFIFSSWLVITTFLHHNDEDVPWYADERWDFVRGNLSSVDRDYGWAHNVVHNIGTHQIHHLFIKIPHYRLEEATAVFRKAYPELVRLSDEPILPSFYKIFHMFFAQRFISDDTKVHVYKLEK